MKFLILAFVLATFLPVMLAEFRRNDLIDVATAHRDCRDELRPPKRLYKKLIKLEFPLHESTPCYVQCLLEKLNMYQSDKGFLVDNIVEQLTSHQKEYTKQILAALDICVGNVSAQNETCSWVFSSFNCFLTENREAIVKSFQM